MTLNFKEHSDGFRALDERGRLIAQVTTKSSHDENEIDGHPLATPRRVVEDLPRDQVVVHWGMSQLTLEEVEAFLEGLSNVLKAVPQDQPQARNKTEKVDKVEKAKS